MTRNAKGDSVSTWSVYHLPQPGLGRSQLKFRQVSAGEEGIAVGSASALEPSDVIFAQYRETGVFQYRGFTLEDFMNQLFANHKDPGRGRNMPVHYGSRALNIVSVFLCHHNGIHHEIT